MTNDSIQITILQDGTIRVSTDEVGQANHLSAEKFLEAMARLAGGESELQRKGRAHAHTHSHDGITHTH